jgi:rhamnosyl/mannosyltransferase
VRVLTVVTEAPPIRSGIAKVAGRMTAGLHELGHDVDVVTSVDVGRRHLGEIRLTAMGPHFLRLRREISGYDVVNLHGPAPTFSDVFLALWRTLPRRDRPGLVYTHHSDLHLSGATPLCDVYNWMHSRLLRAASHVIVSTPSYRERMLVQGARRVAVVPFGIDERANTVAQAGRDDGRLRVAFVGQLRPYKGVDVLLRAATCLPDVAFEIAGSGHREAALRRMAAELRLSNVTFHGAVTDGERNAILDRSHVVVLPSRTRAEAFGIVLLEGMRAGCVPVASDLPGVRDVAGLSGLLVRPGHPRSLVQALCHLRDDVHDRRRRSARSREVAATYGWTEHVLQYNLILTEAALDRHLAAARTPSLDTAMGFVRLGVRSDRASLMLADPAFGALRVVTVAGAALPPDAYRRPSRRGYARRAIGAGEPLLVTPNETPAVRRSVRSALLVPFAVDDAGHSGVVSLSRAAGSEFTEAEVASAAEWVPLLAAQTLDPIARALLEDLVAAA